MRYLGTQHRDVFQWDSIAEEEAQWMGPSLLVSNEANEAAYKIVRDGEPMKIAGRRFSVHRELHGDAAQGIRRTHLLEATNESQGAEVIRRRDSQEATDNRQLGEQSH